MALDIDGFAVLRTIGVHPHLFKAVAADAIKAARTLVTKQIAHKDTGLKTVRDIRAAIGAEAFSLIVDGLTDAQIKSLAAKLDKHASLAKVADGAARPHVVALADGSLQPTEQAQGAPRTARPRKTPAPPSPPGRIQYVSAGAKRKRG
jgi:hypothetical protein